MDQYIDVPRPPPVGTVFQMQDLRHFQLNIVTWTQKLNTDRFKLYSDQQIMVRIDEHIVAGQEKPHICIWPLNMNTEQNI